MIPAPASSTSWYTVLLVGGLALSGLFWIRLARRDSRMFALWLGALLGAFVGAKLAYVLAEGWRDFGQPDFLRRLATGKSILGALLGGYVSVELFKRALGYRQPTGDWFALIVPAGIALGRLGCWLNGCCLGRVCETSTWWTVRDEYGLPRWPSVPLEFAFNLIALVVLAALGKARKFPGNLFHLYVIAYGLFRLFHEAFRDTPRLVGPLSGYSLLALSLVIFGSLRFVQRERESHRTSQPARMD